MKLYLWLKHDKKAGPMPVAIAARNDSQSYQALCKKYIPQYGVSGPCLELETVEGADGKTYKIKLIPIKKK